jgi:hypothetical protein
MTFKETIEELSEAERAKFFRAMIAIAEAGRKAGVPAGDWGGLYAKVCNQVEGMALFNGPVEKEKNT